MFDPEMDSAVAKALKMNSTDKWLARAKEIEAHFNPVTRAKGSRLVESLARNGSGEIAVSNFDWGDDGAVERADEIVVGTKTSGSGGTTANVGSPEMNPVDGCFQRDESDECGECDVEISRDPNRGIKITIGGKTGYLPPEQIHEFIDFAKDVLAQSNDELEDNDNDNDDENDETEEEDDDGEDGDFPDFSAYFK